ncbi:MAG TPA: peptidoglycan-binding domain-containing protein [Azospirillum sp.]|nr:peptidoglycan-binding domain-containing protein [Azospirillum sp.]
MINGSGHSGLPDNSTRCQIKSLPIQVQAQGTDIYVSPAGIRRVQRELNKRGYDAGSVSGAWSPQTQAAVRNFQQANGLEPVGTLDIAIINTLGLSSIFSGQGGEGSGAPGGQRIIQEGATAGTPLRVGPAGVRRVKDALGAAGYAAGDIDGAWNQTVTAALRDFQQAKGLEPTGTLTLATIASLGISKAIIGEAAGDAVAAGGASAMQGNSGLNSGLQTLGGDADRR